MVLDEISKARFTDLNEIATKLKNFIENGQCERGK